MYCFFTPTFFFQPVISCSIGNIIVSDHAAVYLDIKLKNISRQSRHWRLDPSILKDHNFITYFTSGFKLFLSTNSPLACNPSLLWETSKAYARGFIISYTSSKRCKNTEQQNLLAIRLTIADKIYIKKPTVAKLKEITPLHSTVDSLLRQKTGTFKICETKVI